MSNIETQVIEWAYTRGIYANSNAQAQFLKAVSEMGELADALAKGDQEEIEDAIGDVAVCLINVAHLWGTSLGDCLQGAYDTISKRTGKMVNGVFVKDWTPDDNPCSEVDKLTILSRMYEGDE